MAGAAVLFVKIFRGRGGAKGVAISLSGPVRKGGPAKECPKLPASASVAKPIS